MTDIKKGRPPAGATRTGMRKQVVFTAETYAIAGQLGDGNVSAGVRKALELSVAPAEESNSGALSGGEDLTVLAMLIQLDELINQFVFAFHLRKHPPRQESDGTNQRDYGKP